MPSTLRIVVTRPEREALPWVDDLRARGLDAVALPLMGIAPGDDTPAIEAAWDRLPHYRAAMFVSANAVSYFFAGVARSPAAWPAGTRAWAPGPGTARALLDCGVPQHCIDTPEPNADQFDSEALWQVAGHGIHGGDAVLLVRGSDAGRARESGIAGHGREWMAQRLAAAGATVDTVAVYRRALPAWTPETTAYALGLAGPDTAWLFSNSDAIGHLLQLLPEHDALRQGIAVTTHPRIARAARAAGFERITHTRPTLAAVAETLAALAFSVQRD